MASLTDSLVTALVGFLGVVVGAAMNILAQRETARRREHGETLSAARLVDAELAHALAIIEEGVGPQARLSAVLAVNLCTPAWEASRGALAVGLSRNQWTAVCDAFASIAVLRLALQTARDSGAQHDHDKLEGS